MEEGSTVDKSKQALWRRTRELRKRIRIHTKIAERDDSEKDRKIAERNKLKLMRADFALKTEKNGKDGKSKA